MGHRVLRAGDGIKNGMTITGELWFRLPRGRVVEIVQEIEGVLGRYKVYQIQRRNADEIRLHVFHPGPTEKDGRTHWRAAISVSRITTERRKERLEQYPESKWVSRWALCEFSYQEVVGVVRPRAFLAAYYDALTAQSLAEGR